MTEVVAIEGVMVSLLGVVRAKIGVKRSNLQKISLNSLFNIDIWA